MLNTVTDTLLWISSVSSDSSFELVRLRHNQYGHPGIFYLVQLLFSANEAYAIHNIEVCRKVVASCQICAEINHAGFLLLQSMLSVLLDLGNAFPLIL